MFADELCWPQLRRRSQIAATTLQKCPAVAANYVRRRTMLAETSPAITDRRYNEQRPYGCGTSARPVSWNFRHLHRRKTHITTELKDKVAVVTGVSRGIGYSI